MTDPKVNDRVRLSIEGEVTEVGRVNGRTSVRIKDDAGHRRTFIIGPGASHSVEVIPPKYVDGGIYLDDDGDVLRYEAKGYMGYPGWRAVNVESTGWGEIHSADYAATPVLRLDGPAT